MKKGILLSISRRVFLEQLTLAAGFAFCIGAQEPKRFRAVIIGHTGAGNYGHELDLAFQGIHGVQVTAIADPVQNGARKAAERSGAPRTFVDYKVMLQQEKPDIVVIAPRWSEEHFSMSKAALEAGAHLFLEKPFTVDMREADQILELARKKNRKIAVAHQMRMHPDIVHLKRELPNVIGDLVRIDAHGKQDARAGGEDLMVLGTHLFDLMRLFAGDPLNCFSHVSYKEKSISKSSARPAGERIGPVAGDEIEARFLFPKNVTGHFTSRARLRENLGHWGLTLRGTKGSVRILADVEPRIFILQNGPWDSEQKLDKWLAYNPSNLPPVNGNQAFHRANRRLAEDFIDAIQTNREPECSGENGAWAIEMVMAVYQSALAQTLATFPLEKREHPLLK